MDNPSVRSMASLGIGLVDTVGARVAVLAHLGSVAAVKSPSIVARHVASSSRRRSAATSCRALGGPPAIIHLPRGRPEVPWHHPEGCALQEACQSLRGLGFHCRPTHGRRQPKPAGETCSRGAANVVARKPYSEARPHSCTTCLAGSLCCVNPGDPRCAVHSRFGRQPVN